jgi:hypothetical protein
MFRRRLGAGMAALLALAIACPATACAAGPWSWPVEGRLIVAYGATYPGAQGKPCTHGGADIAADAGAPVRACTAGEVSFSGRVPAGEGTQAFAVTVLTADGLKVTYLPLRSISVHRGENVAIGEALGTLAESGDASSAAPHLHLGVHRGGAALDPMSFLGGGVSPVPGPAPVAPGAKAAQPGLAVTHPSATGATHFTRPSSSGAPLASQARASARDANPQASPGQALRGVLPDTSGLIARVPALSRVPEVAAPPALDIAHMAADLRSGQGLLGSLLLRAGLAGLAGGCVFVVVRTSRASGAARAVPLAAAAKRPGR